MIMVNGLFIRFLYLVFWLWVTVKLNTCAGSIGIISSIGNAFTVHAIQQMNVHEISHWKSNSNEVVGS